VHRKGSGAAMSGARGGGVLCYGVAAAMARAASIWGRRGLGSS
jgi:hypothetical protein